MLCWLCPSPLHCRLCPSSQLLPGPLPGLQMCYLLQMWSFPPAPPWWSVELPVKPEPPWSSGFLLSRSLPGPSSRPRPGPLSGLQNCLILPGSTLSPLPGPFNDFLGCPVGWLGSPPFPLSLYLDFSCLVCCCVSVLCSHVCHVLVLSCSCFVFGVPS